MSDERYKIMVERLLKGDFHASDLTKLFLYLRLLPHCGGIVAEIGNFESHAAERDQGITTAATEEFFSFIRFRWPYINGKPIPLDNLPREFPAGLRGNFKRIDDRYIKKKTHLKRPAAKAALESFLAKLIAKADGSFSVPAALSPDEIAIFNCVINRITVRPAFSDRDLVREFGDILVHTGLMNSKDRHRLRTVEKGIALYGASVMHRCQILLADGSKGRLFIVAATDDQFGVCAGYRVPSATIPGATVEIASTMYATRYKFADCCDTTLLTKSLIETDYELTDNQMLRPLA